MTETRTTQSGIRLPKQGLHREGLGKHVSTYYEFIHERVREGGKPKPFQRANFSGSWAEEVGLQAIAEGRQKDRRRLQEPFTAKPPRAMIWARYIPAMMWISAQKSELQPKSQREAQLGGPQESELNRPEKGA